MVTLMADMTEIYICRKGQSLKEGKLELSDYIAGRADAEDDARLRCQRDQRIAKVSYYAVNESGRYRNFYTYKNPTMETQDEPEEEAPAKAAPAKRRPRKTSLMTKLMNLVTEEVKK